MKKVLWLCNIVLPDFSQEFGIKKNPFGGWMTGMLHELEKREDLYSSLCFPIKDSSRLKDGNYHGHNYYSFLCDMNAETYHVDMVDRFEAILERAMPDIIHIWGTEYPHTAAMLVACRKKGMLERCVIHIQGLVSVYARHYMPGVPYEYTTLKYEDGTSMEEDKNIFEKHGRCESESLKMVKHVIGRTDWDRACVEAENPYISYHFCEEILRASFYEYAGSWKYEECQKHSIFVSQASYPVKGFHYLLQALPVIIQRFPDTQVYVAGADIISGKKKQPYAEYLKRLIHQLDVTSHINFIGNLDETQMALQYKKANVFVSASTIENSPNSLREARMVGTPSVISSVGGAYNGIESKKDGFLYPYDEPALLAYYVCTLFENKDDICTYVSENSSQKMRKLSDPGAIAQCNVMIYEEILNSF